jgi:hypothetical protein
MKPLKRISGEEAQLWVELERGRPYTLKRAQAFALFPTQDGGEEVRYYTEAIVDPTGVVRKPEWIYILVNKSYPGICKIGMTTRSVTERVAEINGATGVITPWYKVYVFKCVNAMQLEKDIHLELDRRGYRVNPKREGFEITTHEAISVVNDIGEAYT